HSPDERGDPAAVDQNPFGFAQLVEEIVEFPADEEGSAAQQKGENGRQGEHQSGGAIAVRSAHSRVVPRQGNSPASTHRRGFRSLSDSVLAANQAARNLAIAARN